MNIFKSIGVGLCVTAGIAAIAYGAYFGYAVYQLTKNYHNSIEDDLGLEE